MKIIEFTFDHMPPSAQFCTHTVIYLFNDAGFIEFKAYCMINSMAEPIGLELERIGENRYLCHVLTVCEMTALSEKCILISGKMTCRVVNPELEMTVREHLKARLEA